MKSDRIGWIDSHTIKRGCVLVFDRSLVPFCSECLGACMRANDALTSFEKEQILNRLFTPVFLILQVVPELSTPLIADLTILE